MSLDLIPPEDVARARWAIMRSDNAGVIQTFNGPQRFQHREFLNHHSAAVFDEDLHRLKQDGMRLYQVQSGTEPDPRWSENITAAVSYDDAIPAVLVSWDSTLKPLTDDLKKETKARVWDKAEGVLLGTDMFYSREQEFGTSADLDIKAYRLGVKDAAEDAEEAIDAAADTAALGRAEATFDAYLENNPPPERNPHKR